MTKNKTACRKRESVRSEIRINRQNGGALFGKSGANSEAILASDGTFVAVLTPSDDREAFYAASTFREIGKALASNHGHHLVVLMSTVLPRATRHGLLPILEDESGKEYSRTFGLCYSPESLALGENAATLAAPWGGAAKGA